MKITHFVLRIQFPISIRIKIAAAAAAVAPKIITSSGSCNIGHSHDRKGRDQNYLESLDKISHDIAMFEQCSQIIMLAK